MVRCTTTWRARGRVGGVGALTQYTGWWSKVCLDTYKHAALGAIVTLHDLRISVARVAGGRNMLRSVFAGDGRCGINITALNVLVGTV